MILVSKFMVHARGFMELFTDKTYLSLGLLSPLKLNELENEAVRTQAMIHFSLILEPSVFSIADG